jgi:hypothetical protein
LIIALRITADACNRGVEFLQVSLNDGEQLAAVRGQLDLARRALELTFVLKGL